MVWTSVGSELRLETPAGTERVLALFDRDVELPDPVNEIKKYPTFGAGNKYAKVQMGRQSLGPTGMPLVPVSGEFFYYLLANSGDANSYGVTGTGPYTHTIRPTICPKTAPFKASVSLKDCGVSTGFKREFDNCAFYSGNISASVDEPLRAETQVGATDVTTGTALEEATTASYPDPYMFYMLGGNVSLLGTPITKMESFEISWDNKTNPKTYFNTSGKRTPTELIRGLGELQFRAQVVPDAFSGGTNSLYHLLDTGVPGDVTVQFARGVSDTLTFLLEDALVNSASHPLKTAGNEVSVPVTIEPSSLQITAVDSIPTYAVA